jgi:hypothetical protein
MAVKYFARKSKNLLEAVKELFQSRVLQLNYPVVFVVVKFALTHRLDFIPPILAQFQIFIVFSSKFSG